MNKMNVAFSLAGARLYSVYNLAQKVGIFPGNSVPPKVRSGNILDVGAAYVPRY